MSYWSISATPDGLRRVKVKKKKKEMTHDELAQAAHVANITIRRFFSYGSMSEGTIEAIANALEMQPEEIVDPVEWRNRAVSKITDSSLELITESELSPIEAFYVNRADTEKQCYNALLQPGGMVRVKAPQLTGKTWFIEKVLSKFSKDESYRRLDVEIDRHVLTGVEDFYQWFCAAASEGLELPVELDTYWKGLAPNGDITNYFQKYLLKQIADAQQSLILVLDKVDRVFECTSVANAFCGLLRGWYEQSIKGSAHNKKVWRKLRLVIIHSTEVYGSLDINYSPLGAVGVDFKLSDFDEKQVQELARLYQLSWIETEVHKLMNLVGGHPYLVHLAIAKVRHQNISLDQILNTAHTEVGIFADHLRQLAISLERSPELENLYKEIVMADKPVPLKSVQAFKLDSMGLIHIRPSAIGENLAEPRCRLYGEFFCNHFSH